MKRSIRKLKKSLRQLERLEKLHYSLVAECLHTGGRYVPFTTVFEKKIDSIRKEIESNVSEFFHTKRSLEYHGVVVGKKMTNEICHLIIKESKYV